MAKIIKGDRVKVLSGKDAGKEGRVITVYPAKKKALVEGVNRATRHEKVRPARGRAGQEGGIVVKEMPLDLSNVALICKTDGPTRVGFRIEPDGSKVRICKKCGAEL
ncbi:MAG: 50S ribosomal protein L24 [Actinomycetota bacterium]